MSEDPERRGDKSPHPHTRRAHDEAEYRRYFQDNGVPYNLQNITDPKAYERFEFRSYVQRAATRMPMREFTYEELCRCHCHLFQDVWSWAGQTRTYPTGREGSVFANPEFIETFAKEQFRNLRSENHLKGLTKHAFAGRAAHYVNELNACHPFVEGNGRTIRTFLEDLAENAGYRLDLRRTSRERWYDASRQGFQGSNEPMVRIIREVIEDRQRERTRTRRRRNARDRSRER